jgi:hypothetical protein
MTVAERGASAVLLSMCVLAVPARVALAGCTSPECPNDTIVDPVRQMIAASCDCAGAGSHKRYVRCAKEVVKAAIRAQTLPTACNRTIRRCEARSTCGIRNAAVCCVPKGEGRIKALVTKKSSRCRRGNLCTEPMAAADACKTDGTCASARRGLRSFRSVQQVFKNSCALGSCHSAFARQGSLVLENDGISYANLVGRPSVLPEAQQQGLLRVKPGDPDNSFLIRKLRGLGPGDPMPQAGGPLAAPVISMIADWIRRGAHTTAEECPPRPDGKGSVCDDDSAPQGDFVWHPEPALEVPAANEGFQLYTPPRDVTAGTEWETCYAFRPDWRALGAQVGLPAGQLPTIKQQTYRMHKGSHHLLLYMYSGRFPDRWAQGYFPCNAANCINAADCPPDLDDPNAILPVLIPIGGTQVAGTRYEVKYPKGVGIPVLRGNSVLIVNEHYTNPFQPPQPIYGEAWLNLYLSAPGEFKVILDGIFAINSRDLIVEPFETRTISSIWQPRTLLGGDSTDAAVFQLFGHMHKRGALFQIDYLKGATCSGGDPTRPRACGRDDDCACKPWQTTCETGRTCVRQPGAADTTVYYTTEWDAAPIVDFPPPYFPVNHDEGLRWTCTHVNGVQGDPTRPPKKCEEGCAVCGWDPPSRTCHFCKTLAHPNFGWDSTLQGCVGRDGLVDPAITPRVYAEGEPMPLAFGLLADDDMCNMFGYFINQEDLATLPP